jgi:hypothetical protein
VFVENGARRFRQGATEAKLAEKLEKVRERLAVEASNMERPGADLITHYQDPDRLPMENRWSRKHTYTQRRLCERFAAPIIAAITCQDIKPEHTQKASTPRRRPGKATGLSSGDALSGLPGQHAAHRRADPAPAPCDRRRRWPADPAVNGCAAHSARPSPGAPPGQRSLTSARLTGFPLYPLFPLDALQFTQ